MISSLSLLFFICAITLVQSRVNGPCNAGGRAGTCRATSSCKGSVYRRTAGCLRDPASITCCVTTPCSARGKSGRCYKTSTCRGLGRDSVPSRSGARGCQREPGNVQCCIPRGSGGSPPPTRVPQPVRAPTPARRVAPPPSGKRCTAHGVRGTCIRTGSCRSKSGYTHYRSRAGSVTGCERDPVDVQCCIKQSAARPPQGVPSGLPDSGVLTKCQVARHLLAGGIPRNYLARMTCTAFYESRFNCGAKNLRNRNGSGDYGLMQCNSQYWCSGGIGPSRGADCGVSCDRLTKSCSAAAKCAALILRRQGIKAWYGYTGHKSTCDRYSIRECNLSGSTPSPPPPPPPPTTGRPCNIGSRRGACLKVGKCTGNREQKRGYCPKDPANVLCCVKKVTNPPTPPVRPPASLPAPRPPALTSRPTNGCDIVSPRCSNMYKLCSTAFRVDKQFMPFISAYNACAKRYGTKIGVCSSYRDIAHNRRIGGATRSNHLAGHAIDFNLKARDGRMCNWSCLLSSSARGRLPGVQDTLNCFNRIASPSRWGGNPSHRIYSGGRLDAVHLDDALRARHPSVHTNKIQTCNADRNRAQPMSCGPPGPPTPPPPPPRCTAYGKAGVCKDYRQCGTQAHSYKANLVTGCRTLPAHVRCCVNKGAVQPPRPKPKPVPPPIKRPVPTPPIPSGPSCKAYGVSGKCINVSTCKGDAPRGYCPGPSNIRCCIPKGKIPPPSTGQKWLGRAGSFIVKRLDRSGRRTLTSHRNRVNKFLLHTVEGGTGAGSFEGATGVLDRKAVWPHFIVGRDRSGRMSVGQYLPLDKQGRALRSPANDHGVIQVEICGRAANPFTSDPATMEAVRSLFQAVRKVFPAIANKAPFRFDNSRAYGTRGSVRQSSTSFLRASGLVGHQHAPSNTHWDPGAINPSVLRCLKPACGASVPRRAIDELAVNETEADELFPGYDIDEKEFRCMFPPSNGRPSEQHIKLFVDQLNNAIQEFQIGESYESITSFLAEAGYDTDGFTTFQQRDADVCDSYEGGCKYTRRGVLGLKDQTDYEMLTAAIGVELIDRPELAATPRHAFRIAGAIWKAKSVGEVADAGEFREVSKLVSECRDCEARVAAVAELRTKVKACMSKVGYEEEMKKAPEVCYVLNRDDPLNSGKQGRCVPAEECGGQPAAEPIDYLNADSRDLGMFGGDDDEAPLPEEYTGTDATVPPRTAAPATTVASVQSELGAMMMDGDLPEELLGSPSLEQDVDAQLAAQDELLLPNAAGEMPEAMAGLDPTELDGWVRPRAVWKYYVPINADFDAEDNSEAPTIMSDDTVIAPSNEPENATELVDLDPDAPEEEEAAPLEYPDVKTVSQSGYDASGDKWFVGRAPFGFGDEERGFEYGTNLDGLESDVVYRLVFNLNAEQYAEISDEKRLRLSVAADDEATVAINGVVVLTANSTQQREGRYYNDRVELNKSLVKVGENVIAVHVYNVIASTDTLFDLELAPQPKLDTEDSDEDDSEECKPGTLECRCAFDADEDVMVMPDESDLTDEKRRACDDGLECDIYANKCFLDYDSFWEPEENEDIENDGHLTVEAEQRTDVPVAGFCRSPSTVCCVPADIQSPDLLAGHDNDDEDEEKDPEADVVSPLLDQPYISDEHQIHASSAPVTALASLLAIVAAALVAL